MASGNETTTNFKVDISALKKGIQEANRQIKLANAEFKAAASSMDDWQKSTDGVQKKIDQLRSVLTSQKTILESYKKQLALISAEYGENSKEADEMRIKIANQQAVVNNTERSIRNYTTQLEELERAQQEAADSADEQANASETLTEKVKRQQDELAALKQKYIDVAAEQGTSSEETQSLAQEIENLSDELRDNEESLRDASDAADDLDHTLDDLDPEEQANGFTILRGAIADLVSQGIQMAIGAIKDFATEAIEAGKNFDKSMSNVAALSGASGDELQMLRDTAKEFGSSTQFSATEAADALGYMALAGWDANQSASALGGVLDLAAASGMGLAEASDMVTDYMSAFNMTADKSAYFSDLLAYAQAHANTTAAGLGNAFKNCAANMNAAGQDIETTVSLLSMLANQGLKGSEAGTALTAVMRDMTAKMEDGAIAIGETQVQVMDAQGNYRDLTDILRDVEAATDGMGDAEKATALQSTFTSDSIKGLNLILNAGVQAAADFESDLRGASTTLAGFEKAAADSGIPLDDLKKKLNEAGLSNEDFANALGYSEGSAENFAEILDEMLPKGEFVGNMLGDLGISLEDLQGAMDDSSGTAEEMSKKMNDNLAGDMASLSSKIEGVQIALFEKLEPALRSAVDVFSKLVDIIKSVFGWIIDNKDAVIAALAGIGAAIVAWNIATVVTNIVKMVKALKMMGAAAAFSAAKQWLLNTALFANPIGLVVAAIAGLVTAFIVLWKRSEKFRNLWLGLWEKIKTAFSGFVDAWGEGLDIIKEALSKVGEFFKGIWDSIQESASNLIENVVGFFSGAWEKIKSAWNAASEFFSGVWEGIKEIFSAAIQAIIEFFQPAIDFFTAAWNIIKELAEGCWNLIKAVWSVVAEWFKTHIIQPVAKSFSDLWEAIKAAASTAWDFIKYVWAAVSNWFNVHIIQPVSQFFSKMWDGIKNAASTAWNGIKSVWNAVSGWFNTTIIQPVAKFFTGMWEGLKKGASDAWDGIKSVFSHVSDWFKGVFSKAWQKVKDVFSTGGKVFDGIKDGIVSAFKTVVNAIIRGINKVIAVPFNAINGILDKIQSVSIAGIQPFDGLVSRLPVPEIPELAQGGVLKRGQVGLLEGNGAEAVVPLENNKRWIAATAAELKRALISEGILGARSEVITNNYNFTQNNTSPKALSRLDIYRQSKNLLSLKGAT